MRAFEYASPKSKDQVLGLLGQSWDEAAVLAGGTDLLALMKDDVVHPKLLVNVKQINDSTLKKIEVAQSRITIGSLVTLGDLADHAGVAKTAPILHEALNEAASPQIRNMATLGGNICQRPRCWYFRNGMGLLPKGPNGESLVLKGDNRYHAVLGNDGPAYFVSASTIVPVLIAYGAMLRIVGPKGAREIPLEKFYRTPQNESEREYDLQPNEIVTQISMAVPKVNTGYYEVRQKEAFDWPMASCAAVLHMDGKAVRDARIVLGQVAPVPWVSREAAQALIGKPLSEQTAMEAANAALAGAKSLGKNQYKITIAKVAVKRALLNAVNVSR